MNVLNVVEIYKIKPGEAVDNKWMPLGVLVKVKGALQNGYFFSRILLCLALKSIILIFCRKKKRYLTNEPHSGKLKNMDY